MDRADIVFIVTFPLWIISLIVGLSVTKNAGLLANMICVVITLSLLAANAWAWFKMNNPSVKSVVDDKVDKFFERLKKEVK